MLNDNRLGSTKDGSEPEVCAVSGELVQGRHNIQHMLGTTGYFYRVLSKREEQWTPGLHEKLMALVAKPSNAPKVEADK